MKKKKTLSVSFMLVGILFCVSLITANLLEAKVFRVTGSFSLTGGFLVFPISYILNDCISEVWGFRKARMIIWLGFAMNFFVMAMAGLACVLPPLSEGDDEAFCKVYAFAPQIVVASMLAFVVGSFFNAWIMSKMKMAGKNKGRYNFFFSLRAILSTIVGESVDSLIFFPFAFYLFPLVFNGKPVVTLDVMVMLMATQVLCKTLYEVIALPLTIKLVKFIKRVDGCDEYDDGISYNAFNLADI